MGGVLDEPIGPSKPPTEDPVISPSIDDLLKIKINEEDMIIGTNEWRSITYGNGKYVAVGSSGYVTTSTNGTSWTTPVRIGTEDWYSVTYGNGKFVAVGRKNAMMSTNGTSWTTYNNVSTSYLISVTFGNGKFVMVGSSSYIGTSTNGTSWTKQTANGGYLTDVIFAGDKFRTVGQEGLYTESSDGTNWTTKRFATLTSYYVTRIAYGNNTVVLAGASGMTYNFTEDDPDTVNYVNISELNGIRSTNNCTDIIFSNGKFIAMFNTYNFNGNSGYTTTYCTSSDGNTWTDLTAITDEDGNIVNKKESNAIIVI